MDIVNARPRVKVLNPGSFDCLPFMKSQLLKHSVVIRLSNVRFPRFESEWRPNFLCIFISYVSLEDLLCKNIANTLGELHFAIHSVRKLSVSLQKDEEDALSKDLGMHGDVSCTVRRCDSQVRRAWRISSNHAFRRHRAHEIWCFYVTFSNTELTGSFLMTTLWHAWRCFMRC